jgi:inner membrane protein
MEPVTQVLASVALARAGLNRTTRLATPILIATALAPDLDLLSSFGGADAYLNIHRTVLHSVAGGICLAMGIATAACAADRSIKRPAGAAPLGAGFALLLALAGIAFHDLLDLLNSGGVQLFWPFHPKWFAWSLVSNLDPWILALLVAGLLLPELFKLVGEEIGERKRKSPSQQRWAIAVLALISMYAVDRGALHSRAVDVLLSRTYRGAVPIAAGAFPTPMSPFDWRGVVATDNALIELEVPLGPSGPFDPEHGVVHYKPDPTSALDAAQKTTTARRFLTYAKFPIASIEKREEGFHFELRDLRFPADATTHDNLIAVVDLDTPLQVVKQEINFAPSRTR